jgi:hypothetical protein
MFLVGFFVVACAIYDESLSKGTPVTEGPSTVFGATGWGIGVGGAGPAAGTGSGRGGASEGGAAGSAGKGEGGSGGSGGASIADAAADADAGDGVADGGGPPNGRPTSIAIMGTDASPLAVPSSSGGAYSRLCPSNTVLIGYRGTVNPADASINFLRSFEGICGSLAVTGTTTFAVETHGGPTLSKVGDTDGTLVQTSMCPDNQVVVAFGAHTGSFIDSIAFACAPLVISAGAAGFELSIGSRTTVTAIGGPRGMTLRQGDCPPGTIGIGHAGKAGQDINSFGLLCGTPKLTLD